MKILITGGAGFIGSTLARSLTAAACLFGTYVRTLRARPGDPPSVALLVGRVVLLFVAVLLLLFHHLRHFVFVLVAVDPRDAVVVLDLRHVDRLLDPDEPLGLLCGPSQLRDLLLALRVLGFVLIFDFTFFFIFFLS